MKRSAKNSAKLTLQRESLRVIASVELVYIVGGQPVQVDSRGDCEGAGVKILLPH